MVLSATGLELLSEQLNTLSLSSDPVYPPKGFALVNLATAASLWLVFA